VNAVESAARSMAGVAEAHVEQALGRLVVLAEDPDTAAQLGHCLVHELRAMSTEQSGSGRQRAEGVSGDPVLTAPSGIASGNSAVIVGDRASVAVPLLAAGMDVAAVAGALVGQLGWFPAAPRAARAAVAVVRHQPRVVALLQTKLGVVGTDLVLTAATAGAHGWGHAPAVPMLDLAQRVGRLAEVLAYRRAWAAWEPVLTATRRPRAPLTPPLIPPGSTPASEPGEESLVGVLGGEGGGQIESYLDQAASGSLVAAAGALLGGGGAEDVAGAVLAGVPKAAQLGREGFASVLGRGLAQRDIMVLNPDALRRLDRVAVILIDGAALRGDHRMVVHARGHVSGWDDDRVYEVADALLHGETAPEPDPDEAPATEARLRWLAVAATAPAEGLQRAELVARGEVVGSVEVGFEPDPYALALMETARRTGARVVLRHVAGTAELATSVAETHQAGTALAELVTRLRTERGPVLLVTSLHPDIASADTLSALAVADVSVALDDPRAQASWEADIITSPELAEAVRVLSALPAARRTTATAVRAAKAGSTLEGLLLTTGGPAGGPGWLSLGRWLSPVNATAAAALVSGVFSARGVLGLPDPTPVPLTAWHALDPEIVFARLTGGPAPIADPPAVPGWRRRLSELGEHEILAPLYPIGVGAARLARATRAELDDPLTPVLAVGAAASAMLGSGVDAALVATVMATNAVVGGAQRLRAENAVARLFAEQDQRARRVNIPVLGSTRRRLHSARISSRTQSVLARRLRPGDVIELRSGDVVPADARLLAADELEVDESSLTGESLPVTKCTDQTPGAQLGERAGMVFEGATIVAGSARAVVVATGAATAARRAVATVADAASAVGIAARLSELTAKVLPLTLASGAAVTGISLLNRQPLRQAVADGVAIAVTAVPEGLPLVATVAQLAAARRLSALGVLVRAPRAIEALARVDTICFDKTGTLTENTLRVTTTITPNWDPDTPPPPLEDTDPSPVLRAAARACPPADDPHAHAHATDEAILRAAQHLSADTGWTVLAQVPFESSRGYAATLATPTTSTEDALADDATANPDRVLVMKGAPEIVLERCALTDSAHARAHVLTDALAGRGLRVLAIAQRTVQPEELQPEVVPDTPGDGRDQSDDAGISAMEVLDGAAHQMQLVGFVGIADTLRHTAPDLVTQLVAANHAVVLITGDHPVTAAAIATQLGLPADAKVITGAQLADLDEAGRAELATQGRIFARVSPEQKVQIIQALGHAGRVCAMVGDGANDAAAIRLATVGIGVSSRGSSAARSAADLVVTEDDLTVLLDALAEGRDMWASVRDALIILLGGNAGEVAFTIAGTTLGGRAPISTRQLLLVNLLTDMFPALAVAVTPQQPPPGTADPAARLAHRQSILAAPAPSLDRPLIDAILTRGAVTAAAATGAWGIGALTPGTRRRSATMGLTALVGTQLAQTLAARHHSPLVLATTLGSAAVLVAIVQTPGVSHFFGCTPLGPIAWAGVLASTGIAAAASIIIPTRTPAITAQHDPLSETG
jgi:cation-transporting ATPase I